MHTIEPTLTAELEALLQERGVQFSTTYLATIVQLFPDIPEVLAPEHADALVEALRITEEYLRNVSFLAGDEEAIKSIALQVRFSDLAGAAAQRAQAVEDAANPWLLPAKLDLPACKRISETLTPEGAKTWQDALRSACEVSPGIGQPIEGTEFLSQLIRASPRTFNFDLGTAKSSDSERFVMAPSLILVAAFGFDQLREYAVIRRDGGEACWAPIALATDDELRVVLTEARKSSGTPMGLLLIPFHQLLDVVEKTACEWIDFLKAAVLIYIAAHVRLERGDGTEWRMRCMVEHQHELIAVSSAGATMGLSSQANQALVASIRRILRLPKEKQGEGDAMTMNNAISSVFSSITPKQIPRAEEPPPNLILPTVVIAEPTARRSSSGFYQNSFQVRGAKIVDMSSGVVSVIILRGSELLRYTLPFSADPRTKIEHVLNELDGLPEEITPAYPGADMVDLLFPNIQTTFKGVECREGMIRLFNMYFVTDLLRADLAGSTVGQTLIKEFPGLFFGSSQAGELQTSGQGKSTAAQLATSIICPGAALTRIARTTGAVAQRTSGQDVLNRGLLAADEFKLAEIGEDHWCDREGLQSLMTGSTVSIGRVGENTQPSRLQHFVILSGKYSAFPRDIRSRTVPILMSHRIAPTAA